MEIIIKVISDERDKAREIVESIIDSEQNYLFTNDMDYKESKSSIITPNQNNEDPRQQPQGEMPRGTNSFVRDLRDRIDSYFQLVLRSVKDSVPKAIGYFLVRKSQDKLQFELYK